jgi:hypothetical protein
MNFFKVFTILSVLMFYSIANGSIIDYRLPIVNTSNSVSNFMENKDISIKHDLVESKQINFKKPFDSKNLAKVQLNKRAIKPLIAVGAGALGAAIGCCSK